MGESVASESDSIDCWSSDELLALSSASASPATPAGSDFAAFLLVLIVIVERLTVWEPGFASSEWNGGRGGRGRKTHRVMAKNLRKVIIGPSRPTDPS